MILYLLLALFVCLNYVDAATYSIAFFKQQDEIVNFNVQVNAVANVFDNASSGHYYNFEYNVGDDLGVNVSLDASNSGYYLIKNGPDGSGKLIYDSRGMTFLLENKCPEGQTICRIDIWASDYDLDGAVAFIYVNNVYYGGEISTGLLTTAAEPGDVIKIVVTGTPNNPQADLTFQFYNFDDQNVVYGYDYWYYNNYVSDALIQTAAILTPKEGSVYYPGDDMEIILQSTPVIPLSLTQPYIPTSFNVQLMCEGQPPVIQTIESNSLTLQTMTIPAYFTSQLQCSLSVVDSLSGLNTVKIILALTREEISQCARNFALQSISNSRNH